jgi:hypothetical protein
MPVLDRPNSDAQRLQALKAAKAKAAVTDPSQLAFGADVLNQLTNFLPQFEQKLQERSNALGGQTAATAAANPARARLAMYAKHFIHVLNMGIDRGVYPPSARAFYKLHVLEGAIPQMGTDAQRLEWGQNIVNGDAARVVEGGAPMVNPTAAEVGTELSSLEAALADQMPARDKYDREQELVEEMRPEADRIIADVWDEVLFSYRKDTPSSMRRKAREYGVTYRPSKGETPTADEFSLKGTVTDETLGTPLQNAEVLLQGIGQSTYTDQEGRYIFGLHPPGNYILLTIKDGYLPKQQSVTLVPGTLAVADVQLKSNTTET